MRYIVDGFDDGNHKEYAIEEVLENITESEFDELLDQGEEINIWGNIFSPSQVLRRCDEDAYNECFSNYIDSLRDDLDRVFCRERDTIFHGVKIEFVDDEEEDDDGDK